MDTLIHADIFFFITAISVVVLSIGTGIVIYYLVRILRRIDEISEKVRAESDEIVRDVKDFRATMRSEGIKVKTVLDMFLGFVKKAKNVKPKKISAKLAKMKSELIKEE